jgi:hypothetical protein
MKYFLSALLLLISFLPTPSDAAIQSRKSAPVLYSVLDAPQQPPVWHEVDFLNAPATNETGSQWFRFRQANVAKRRETSIYLMLGGAAVMGLGEAIIVNASKQENSNTNTKGFSSSDFTWVLGPLVCLAGLGMFVAGLIVLLVSYSRHGRWY